MPKGIFSSRSYSSPRDKKRHIKYMGLLKQLGSLFLSRKLASCSPKAHNYSRQDAKGHLTHHRWETKEMPLRVEMIQRFPESVKLICEAHLLMRQRLLSILANNIKKCFCTFLQTWKKIFGKIS